MQAMIETTLAGYPQVSRSADDDRHPIEAEAKANLRATGYTSLGSIDCHFSDGVLTLSGTVASYYQKQVAQTAVLQLEGVENIANQIEVRKSS